MSPESLQPFIRERAINPVELKHQSGEEANKMTLQREAEKAGLPVPHILTDDEAREFFVAREAIEYADEDAFYRLRLEDQWRVYIRGYIPHSSEMWEVDTMPTTSVPSFKYIDEYRIQRFPDQIINSSIPTYLKRNFGTTVQKSDIQFFLQKSDPGSVYCSMLTIGSYDFIVGIHNTFSRGVNWETRVDDRRVATEQWHLNREMSDQIVALGRLSTEVLQESFPYRSSDFHFKHDFLWSPTKKTTTLIQSRVSSRAISNEDLSRQNEQIDQLLHDGMQIISLEPGGLSRLVEGRAPQTPFILELTNDQHAILASTSDLNNLDLRGMAGLILPEYLRGGLLQHDGYRCIAYALYWGLPISFSA